MSLGKRLMRSAMLQGALARLIAGYVRLVYATSRWEIVGLEHLQALRSQDRALIACFWHQRIMMMRFLWQDPAPFSVLVSPHRDGRLLSRTMQRLRIGIIEGSSNRDGTAGLRAVIRTLKAGGCVAITPDGPRGPRMRAHGGVVTAARAAGVPILPAAFSVRRRRVLDSWDRFVIALPFTRGVYVIGPPVDVTNLAPESARRLIEDRLNDVTHHADRLAGVEPIDPAPAETHARA